MAHGLSRAIRLPHPPVSLVIFLVVEKAIKKAWQILRQRPCPDLDLLRATEDRITQKFCEVLCDEVYSRGRVPGFDRELFGKPTREPKVRNYNDKHPDKMPDLLLDLVDRPAVAKPSQDWLFIECKPVDVDHPVGSCYCDKGLIRFVNGDYAWAMQEAMMVGYAREGYTISPKLTAALKERSDTIPTEAMPSPCRWSSASRFGEVVHASKHGRTFPYEGADVHAPPITIRHLWLRRD